MRTNYMIPSWSESDDLTPSESDLQPKEPNNTARITRVEDVMRMFSSPSTGSRRFTSVVIDKPDRHLLSYGNSMEDSTTENPRASARIINFIHAMSTIYGEKVSLSQKSFVKWRRKFMNWVKLKTLVRRVAKESEIQYTIDLNTFRPENQIHAQRLRHRLRNELKTYVFYLNNSLERPKLEHRLDSLHKKRLKNWITELGHQEYKRVQKLLVQDSLSPEELAALNEFYFKDPPKATPKNKGALTEVPRNILWHHIPVMKLEAPRVYSLNPLQKTIVTTLKSLAEDAPELKQTLYAVERNKVDSSTSQMRTVLEEAFGPPSTISSHTADYTEHSEIHVSRTPSSVQSSASGSLTQTGLNPIPGNILEKQNPTAAINIPQIKRIKWIPNFADDTGVYETRTIKTLYDEAARLLKTHINCKATCG